MYSDEWKAIAGMMTTKLFNGYSLVCDIVHLGNDYNLAVYGGDTPHVGSVVMSVARPSLTGEGIGVTSSVLTKVGHKDDAVAKLFAETLAKKCDCTVVCTCGIHVDNITPEQIDLVKEASLDLLTKLLSYVDSNFKQWG